MFTIDVVTVVMVVNDADDHPGNDPRVVSLTAILLVQAADEPVNELRHACHLGLGVHRPTSRRSDTSASASSSIAGRSSAADLTLRAFAQSPCLVSEMTNASARSGERLSRRATSSLDSIWTRPDELRLNLCSRSSC